VNRPVHQRSPESTSGSQFRSSPFQITGTLTEAQVLTGGSVHRIYGHSLVPGGIHSVDELMAVIERDPQLAEHYKNFDLSKAHIITLDHDVVAYVSYRLDRGIYWEAHPTIIAKGEEVITDGLNFIRTRCGNEISYAPGFPTSPDEPADINLVVELRYVGPSDSVVPTDGPPAGPESTIPGPPPAPAVPVAPAPAVPVAPSPSGTTANVVPPGEPLPPLAPLCCIGGGGGPFVPGLSPSAPPVQFEADEFPRITLAILGHAYGLPSEVMALVAGILLVVTLRLALSRNK
jgi:hypothetical protein